MTTAVIVEHGTLSRRGLQAILPQAGVRCVGTAATATEGYRLVIQSRADLIVIGSCPDTRPIDLLERIAGLEFCRPLVIAPIADVVAAYQLYKAGAIGVASPNASEDEFRQLFECAARGRRYVPPNLLIDALDAPPRPATGLALSHDLTTRERDVLTILALGHTNREIADQLCIGIETVKSHLNSIYAKFAVSRRSQAVSLAIRHQLL